MAKASRKGVAAKKAAAKKTASRAPIKQSRVLRSRGGMWDATHGHYMSEDYGWSHEGFKAVENDITPQLGTRPDNIPEDQWNLPASYKPDGSFATLAEMVSKPIITYRMALQPVGNPKELIVERIKRQLNYPVRQMLGVGEVDRERAIAEVETGTEAGKYIEESEQRAIQLLTKRAEKAMTNG